MELRQLRYFVRVVELGSMGRAALDLGVVTSALSQQISRLEGELSTRLLQRTSSGVIPTDAGLAFWRQAQLVLRHADSAVHAAQQARLSGSISIGLSATTATVLAQPFLASMHERYPNVRLHLVESLSGHLATMLNARQLDLAILFHADAGHRWSVVPILEERLMLIARRGLLDLPAGTPVRLQDIAHVPLVTPSRTHGLRSLIDDAFGRAQREPNIALEIDGITSLMDAVLAMPLASIQPGSVTARLPPERLETYPVDDPYLYRRHLLVSVSDEELSPAGLAARVVLADVMRDLVSAGDWPGASLHET